MTGHPAVHAVETYLATMFPRSIIQEYECSSHQCWAFKIIVSKQAFHLLVKKDLLDNTSDSEIERLLAEWHVALKMKRLIGDGVVVTADGVTEGLPESVRASLSLAAR